jgi:glycosyltransferase involved in cell wall biosynthesis
MNEPHPMKLIWFSHIVPFPPRGGNLQRSFNLLREASRSYEIHLMALNLQGEPLDRIRGYEAELRQYCEDVEICELPFPWGGPRWWAEAMCSPLFRAPFSCRALFSGAILARWKELLGSHPGALLHFDSIDLALYADSAKAFRKVLNHHNCESAMTQRQAANEKNPVRKKYLQLQARKLAQWEQSLCASFEVNTVVSELDSQLLQQIQPKGHYHVVENGVDIHHFTPVTTEAEAHSVIFTGWLGWRPNISAMGFLVEKVWPQVKRSFPDARLYLAGKNPPEHVLRWPEKDSSIVVVPDPEDMRPWLARAAVCVCPILEGGGTRLKILDAMAMGKPVVSSTIGCEGLSVTHGENILVADTPQDFAGRLVELFEDENLCRRLGAAGRSLVEREYCWERIGQQLNQAYRCALQPQRCGANPSKKSKAASIVIAG